MPENIKTTLTSYPILSAYTNPVKKAERPIIGRDLEIQRIKAALMRPELCNVMLLAPPGSGKTACVQGAMLADPTRLYLEVDLSKMITDLNDPNEMASRLKNLFTETADFVKQQNRQVVLFIDEFHQVVQLSKAAVEALKPLLADSGTRGIRVIAATTFVEFREHISPNQPLVERLQRINLPAPDKTTTMAIMRGMAETYKLGATVYNTDLFELIYEYTERYMPASSQPRKSLLVMDAMIGWNRATGRPMDMQLLADVIYESEGVNVAFRVDAKSIKTQLDKEVLSQDFATSMIENRLQLCVADLNTKTKPMSSFLFSGSTGVGKQISDNTMIPVYTADGSIREKRNGDLVPGDYVFNRLGKPVKVLGVYPQGLQDSYEFGLTDGRVLPVGKEHLWQYHDDRRSDTLTNGWFVGSTGEILSRGLHSIDDTGDFHRHISIPTNGAVEYPDADLPVDPYVLGVFLVAGSVVYRGKIGSIGLQSFCPAETAEKFAKLIGAASCDIVVDKWLFEDPSPVKPVKNRIARMHVSPIFDAIYDDISAKYYLRKLPDVYLTCSIEQRRSLIQGILDGGRRAFDPDSIDLSSPCLVQSLRKILQSLGVDYHVASYLDTFFGCSAPVDKFALTVGHGKADWFDEKQSDMISVKYIRKSAAQESMTCISVDDPESLYLAGDYIVTHNTAVCKALARILFESDSNLIQIDMTEYANSDSLERFRRELTNQVWARPHSIILLDEVEKACAEVTRLLLQVLDSARLIDENNRVVQFVNSYIIMTTNAGHEIYKTIAQYNSSDTGSSSELRKYDKLIRDSIVRTTGGNKFPPELLGRIDVMVPFQPLSEGTMKEIVKLNILKLQREVAKKHGIELKFHSDVIRYLVEDTMDTDSDSGGARAVISRLESEVSVAVAAYINSHAHDSAKVKYMVVYVVGEMVRDNEKKLQSDARIVVAESLPPDIAKTIKTTGQNTPATAPGSGKKTAK